MSQQNRTQQTPKNGNKLNTVPSTVNNTTSTLVTPRNNVSTTSSTKSSSNSSKDASGGMSKEDADNRRKDKIPEWQLNINSFFCEKSKRKRCDSDDDTIEIVENESNHSPYSSDHLSPTNGLGGDTIKNIMMGEEETEVKFWDPRGFRSSKMLMPSTYCPSCRCPEMHCHNKVFGLFCELHIVHEVYHADYPLTTSTMESLYRERYNNALQFKIYEKTTMLDVTPTSYPLPTRIHENSLTDCVDYINFRKYHFRMSRRIMMGRDTPFDGASLED